MKTLQKTHLYETLKNKVNLRGLLNKCSFSTHEPECQSLEEDDAYQVLERFNYLITYQANNINISEVLKSVIIDDLCYDFCALCLINFKLQAVDVSFIDPQGVHNFIIPLEDSTKDIFELFNKRNTTTASKDLDHLLKYNIGKKIKKVFCLPIKFENDTSSILCVGSSKYYKRNNKILKLIAQQLSLYLKTQELHKQLRKNQPEEKNRSLITHKRFQELLNQELEAANESGLPVSLMILDVNSHAKLMDPQNILINNETTAYVSNILKENIHKIGIGAKINQSKLAVILPETTAEYAQLISNRFKNDLNNNSFLQDQNIVVSMGIATYPTNSINKEELLLFADNALSKAKQQSEYENQTVIVNAKNLNFKHQKPGKEPLIFFNYEKPSNSQKLADELITHLNNANNLQYNSTLMLEIISSLAAAIDAKDSYTCGHSQAVSRYAEFICNELGLSQEETEKIAIGALMHDIGKIGIPENVLVKPGNLDDQEWEIIKQHPTIGARRIIQPISALNELIPVVEHHHERWDGMGYPNKLRGEQIPLGARIVSIADAFHTMTADRPYRKALGYNKAVLNLQQGAGNQWDSSIIHTFLKVSQKAFQTVQSE